MYECDACGTICYIRTTLGGIRVCNSCAKIIKAPVNNVNRLYLETRDRGIFITRKNRNRTTNLIEKRLERLRKK